MTAAITQTDIFGIFARANLRAKHVLFADERYVLPDPVWIQTTFSNILRDWNSQLGLSYREQDYDCDDFARFAATLAGLLHRRTNPPGPISALAFGEMWYLRDGLFAGHAINVAIVGANPTKLFFFDPQTYGEIELDRIQLSTVELVRF